MIGIFDSGVGGLSVFREIKKILPDEDYIYYSDSANCPYGGKPQEFIIQRACEITDLLLSKGAQIIVVACNTATAIAVKSLRERYPQIKFIGMEPAIKPAAQTTESGVIGVLATAGTLSSDKYLRHKEKYASEIKIAEHVGDGFVELVEKGMTTGALAEETVLKSLKPLLDAGADTIVLGCTHYPFLSETICNVAEQTVPGQVKDIIDPAPAIARHLKEVMEEEGLFPSGTTTSGQTTLLSSGDTTVLQEFFNKI